MPFNSTSGTYAASRAYSDDDDAAAAAAGGGGGGFDIAAACVCDRAVALRSPSGVLVRFTQLDE